MKSFFKLLFTFIIIFGFSVGIYLVSQEVIKNLQLDDSDALLGGDLEKGYPSAGYLINYTQSGGVSTCGYTALGEKIGITAGHCADDSKTMLVGKGDFKVSSPDNLKVDRAIQKEDWVKSKKRSDDFTILNFNAPAGYFQSFAKIASPIEGCHYRVVAYGRTQDPTENFTKPRKSAVMCASNITSDIFYIQAKDAGICHGDSGSPLYYENTENVVGIIVSIILEDETSKDPCSIGNKAIVVRVDANNRIITENFQDVSGSVSDISTSDTVQLGVVKENFIEKLGLATLTREEKLKIAMFGGLGILSLIVIILIVLVSGGGEKKMVVRDGYYIQEY